MKWTAISFLLPQFTLFRIVCDITNCWPVSWLYMMHINFKQKNFCKNKEKNMYSMITIKRIERRLWNETNKEKKITNKFYSCLCPRVHKLNSNHVRILLTIGKTWNVEISHITSKQTSTCFSMHTMSKCLLQRHAQPDCLKKLAITMVDKKYARKKNHRLLKHTITDGPTAKHMFHKLFNRNKQTIYTYAFLYFVK